jgi:hypothetical protein
MNLIELRRLGIATALGLSTAAAQANFAIHLSFNGLSSVQQSYFIAAENFWTSAITGYQPVAGNLNGISIAAKGAAIDGVGGVLGSAGPDTAYYRGNEFYTATGSMTFDTADIDALIAQGSFGDVILHEMAHVIGFGTLWGYNGVYVNNSGQFTGSYALSTYRIEFNQPTATFVPVELGGSAGTANSHWNEVDGGSANTGITDASGRDFKNELMTGWLNTPAYVSQTTIASFADIGYTVNLAATVPEPDTLWLWLAGAPLLALAARRLQRTALQRGRA